MSIETNNLENGPSLIRDEHDREHPYFILSRNFIRDNSLSVNLRWFLSYCLSFDPKFVFRIPWIMKTQGLSKNKMYAILNEGIEKGYIFRDSYLQKGLRKWRYIFSEIPKFKKCLPCPQNRDLEKQDLENEDTKNYQSSSYEEEKKEQYKECSDPPDLAPTSADASELTDFFHSKIKEKKKDFLLKNKSKWLRDFDLMLRVDKRSKDRILEIITWLVDKSDQLPYCCSPDKLRKRFDGFEFKVQDELKKSLIKKNREYALQVKERYPDEVVGLSFDTDFVKNIRLGKEIPFNLPHETFKTALIHLFKGD